MSRANEGDDLLDEVVVSEFLRRLFDTVGKLAGTEKKLLIGAAQIVNALTRKFAALHADNVEAGQSGIVAARQAEGNDVRAHAGERADHRVGADAAELMHGGQADHAMTAQRHAVREHDVVPDLAVMGDMAVCHEEAAVPDARHAAAVLGPEIHGNAFPDIAIGADDQAGLAAAVTRRLRRRAERGEGIDHGARADRGMARDVDLRHETASIA